MAFDTLKNYFLGLMPANEAESLDLRIIAGEMDEAELIEAEHELIENYLDESLTNDEMRAFRENFLISNERRSSLEIVSSLRNLPDKPFDSKRSKPIFFEQIIGFFKLRPISLVFASIALFVFIGVSLQVIFVSNPTALETELANLNKQDLSDLAKYKDFRSLTLTSDSLRSGGNGNVISEKDVTDSVLIRLVVSAKSVSSEEFSVKIIDNGKPLREFSKAAIGQEIRLLLPKTLLKKGDFQINIERKGEKYSYNFTVE